MELLRALRMAFSLAHLACQPLLLAMSLLWSSIFTAKEEEITATINTVMKDTDLDMEDWKDSVFSLAYVKSFWKTRYLDLFKDAVLHGPAPNPDVITLEKGLKVQLLDFQKAGRPLIVNFGSCS